MSSPPSWWNSKPTGMKQAASKTQLHVLSKRQLTFTGLYGVISQKVELCIITAMRTSDLAVFLTVC
jgi:hypothetical protein